MEIKYDKYNVITYLKNYGSDVFDPIDYYKLNKNIYNNNFIELLKYILCLSGDKCKEIDQRAKYLKDKVPEFEIIDDVKIVTIDLNEIKKLIKELIILINDLYKIFIMLYNLEMGFAHYIQKGNYDYIMKNKDNLEKILIKTNIAENDIEEINNSDLNKDKFIPLKYTEYKIENLDKYNDEELIALSEILLEDTVSIENGIMKLLKLSEKLSFVMDIEEISKKILKNIIPKDYIKDDIKNNKDNIKDFMMIGGKGLVIEAYDKLFELKKELNDITTISYEKEIPTGINLTVDEIKQLLKNIHIKIENDSVTSSDTDDEKKRKKKIYEYNLFEPIPGYFKMPGDKFIKNPLEPKLPEQQDILISFKDPSGNFKDSSGNFKFINDKIQYFNTNIKYITKLINKLTSFFPKLKDYKDNELKFINDLTEKDFTFSNIGMKSDIETDIKKLDDEIKNLNEEIIKKEDSLIPYKDETKLVEYLEKKKENNYKENNYKDNKEKYIKELKKLLYLDNIIDNNGNKNVNFNYNEIYDFYDEILEKQNIKLDYKTGDFKNYIENEEWKKINDIFINIYKSEIKGKINDKNNRIKQNIINLLRKNSRGEFPIAYRKEKKGIQYYLEELIKLSPDLTLQNEINSIENKNPNFLTLYEDIIKIKPFTDRFWNDISNNINKIKTDIENEINNKKKEKITKEKEKDILNKNLNESSEEPNFENILQINSTLFKEKINYLNSIINNINIKIRNIFIIKNGKDENPFEENISTNLTEETHNWYKRNLFGGKVNDVDKYIVTLNNINEFHEFNEKLKKLLVKLDEYKSLSSNLLNIYIDIIKNIQDIIIYIYYKLTVFKNIKEVNIKFKKEDLEILKSELNSINRKNFDFIKEYYKKFIDKILNIINTNKYIDNDINKKSIYDIIILYHIKENINVF